MHSLRPATRRARRNDRGAAAIVIALSMIAMLVVGGMVLDFGVIRVDRQANKLAADDAVMAGLKAADKGSTAIFSEAGVCGALAFLKVNRPDFNTLPDNNCATADPTATCNAASPFTYVGTVSLPRRNYTVTIRSPFQVNDGVFPEDSYASVSSDVSTMSGCDQIGVIIEEKRKPGLGSVANPADLVTKVRSVGRVAIGPGSDAPAMLLLKRTGCPILQTGAASGGSYIHVYGAVSTDGLHSQAGTIHADSDGSGCGSDSIMYGKGSDGIVVYAAPQLTNPSAPDPTKPGVISTTAGANGAPIGTVRDADDKVYSSGAVDESGAGSMPKTQPIGRALVTRKLVDQRYLSGVTTAIGGANTTFNTVTAAYAGNPANGWKKTATCSGGGVVATLPALTSADMLYVDCPSSLKSIPTIDAGTVLFNGKVDPSATISMPNATKVYITGSSSNAVILSGSGTLSMHTSGTVDATGNCSTASTANKAVLFVKDGQFKQTGGTLRMCNTTVMMMGGRPTGCLPAVSSWSPDLTYVATGANAPAPTQLPCTSGTTMGTGQISQTGGAIDWTAPNQYDVMTLTDGTPDPAKAPAWSDPNGPEDLALWSESAGNNTSTTYNMAGGGLFAVRGVFMVPNADSFILSGGALLDLRNAQYIATSIALNGSTTRVKMAVDPNSAVTLPKLTPFTLVR